MAMIKSVERQIATVEGFEVSIVYRDGRNVRGDKTGLPPYRFEHAAMHDYTVAEWREKRFSQVYPGYDVIVWLAYSEPAAGQTKLATVRDTYLEGD